VQIVETLEVGGLETMALNLAIAHRQAGHLSAIFTLFGPGTLEKEAHAAGIPVVALRKKKGARAGPILRIARQLRADGVQIVHTHNAAVHPYGALAGQLAGAAVINTRHGLALHSTPGQEVNFRRVLPLTRAVVFVCEYGRQYYEPKGIAPQGKNSVIWNGIPVERFQAFRAAPGSQKPKLCFGTIGRCVRAKAHQDLLEAFDQIAKELPEAELEIWGYGELQTQLEDRIRAMSLGNRVRFRGAAENPAKVLQNMDVFVLSSISEGLPLVILEAMAAGLPIVSTRVGGVPEVAPEGTVAWFAEPGNPSSLAEALRRAAASDLAAAGQTAYETAAREFGISKMQQAYESLYRRVLSGGAVKGKAGA
jgi:glycosyltransferase involved in cell wall biosynthesis